MLIYSDFFLDKYFRFHSVIFCVKIRVSFVMCCSRSIAYLIFKVYKTTRVVVVVWSIRCVRHKTETSGLSVVKLMTKNTECLDSQKYTSAWAPDVIFKLNLINWNLINLHEWRTWTYYYYWVAGKREIGNRCWLKLCAIPIHFLIFQAWTRWSL